LSLSDPTIKLCTTYLVILLVELDQIKHTT